jgi:hypothetical protein
MYHKTTFPDRKIKAVQYLNGKEAFLCIRFHSIIKPCKPFLENADLTCLLYFVLLVLQENDDL